MREHRLKLQLAKLQDAFAISQLLNDAYRGPDSWTSEYELVSGARASVNAIKNALKDSDIRYLVCKNSNTLLGCVSITFVANEAYIGALAVLPARQRQGLGSHLLKEAEQICSQDFGVTLFSLAVVEGQDNLLSFCEHRGYRKTGYVEPYPKHLKIGTPKFSDLKIEYLMKKAR